LQYGAHAIELIEADKKPANMDDAAWKQYKTTLLPSVYQSMGLLNLVKGDQAAAKAQFVKASELAPSDAFNFLMLAGMLNDEYQNEAKHYQSLPAGPAKTDELKKAQAMLDAVIDAYAHAIALAEVSPWLPWCHEDYSIEESREFVSTRGKSAADGEWYSFGVFEKDSGKFLGGVGLNFINRVHLMANLGYWVRTNSVGHGVATSATRLAARFGFEELGL